MSGSSAPMIPAAVLISLWMAACSAFMQLENHTFRQYVSTLSIAQLYKLYIYISSMNNRWVTFLVLLLVKVEKSSTFQAAAHTPVNQIVFMQIFQCRRQPIKSRLSKESDTEKKDGGPNSVDGRICTKK